MGFHICVNIHVIYQQTSPGLFIFFSNSVSNSQLLPEAQIRPRSDFDTQCKLSQFALRFCVGTTWDFSIFEIFREKCFGTDSVLQKLLYLEVSDCFSPFKP